MTNLESAVVGLLEQLARISDEHDEVLDTDVREAMRLTVSWYFVWGQPRTRFPRSFGMSSADGDRQVADALKAFLDAAERSSAWVRIPPGQPRLDILQSDAAQTAAGATYDEFVGDADTLTPAAPLPEHMFEEAAYDDDDDDDDDDDSADDSADDSDDRELTDNPLVQRWRAKQIDAEPLDSPRWATWTHSYGSADDVPELLRRLAVGSDDDDLWEESLAELWSALRHQGDLHDVTYAVYPYVADLGSAAPQRRKDCAAYLAEDLQWIDERVKLPSDVRRRAEAAVAMARTWEPQLLREPDVTASEVAVTFALRGCFALAEIAKNLEDEFNVACPHCEEEFPATRDSFTATRSTLQRVLGRLLPSRRANANIADVTSLLRRGGHGELADQVESLTGKIACDHCHKEFRLT